MGLTIKNSRLKQAGIEVHHYFIVNINIKLNFKLNNTSKIYYLVLIAQDEEKSKTR